MKICLASSGNNYESTIDSNFGRCSYFVFYDTENQATEFLPNPFKENEEKAGEEAVSFIYKKKVSMAVSSEFGIKIKPLLDSYRIQMVVVNNRDKKIIDMIQLFKKKYSK